MKLPPLSPEEYEQLREDIRTYGVLVPILVDEEGVVLDGHHRLQVAQELGIDCPVRVLLGLSPDEKLEMMLRANLLRRQLQREQKQQLAIELRQMGWTLDRIAQMLGCGRSTVHSWLDGIDVPLPERSQGKHSYPMRRQPPSVTTHLHKLPKVLSLIQQQETPITGDITDRQLARAPRTHLIFPVGQDTASQAVVCPWIPAESVRGMVRCVCANLTTDHTPEQIDLLAQYTEDVVDDNGIALIYAPVSAWSVIAEMFSSFELYHVFAVVHRASHLGRFLYDWKPLFYFVRGEHFALHESSDVFLDTLSGALFHVLDMLTEPNDVIVAPFYDEHLAQAAIHRTILLYEPSTVPSVSPEPAATPQ